MTERLDGMRIVITGGSSGMAGAAVTDFVGRGARVASLDVADAAGEALATEAGEGARYIHCDVSKADDVASAIAEAAEWLGGIDAVVHAAAIAPGAPAEVITLDDWERVMAINLRGTFLINQAVFPYLKEQGGRIVNFASGAGVKGMVGKAHYSASKGAVLTWTRTIAQEWGRFGITVNAVSPAISTPMYAQTRASMTVEQLVTHDRQMAEMVPLGGKLGDVVEDFLPVLRFLVSEGSRFITGQTIQVDGGMLMVR